MAKKNNNVNSKYQGPNAAAGAVPNVGTEEFGTDTNTAEVRRQNAKSQRNKK